MNADDCGVSLVAWKSILVTLASVAVFSRSIWDNRAFDMDVDDGDACFWMYKSNLAMLSL